MATAETDVQRTRTIAWDDPMIGAKAARGMTGLVYLRAIRAGEIPRPPIAWSLDFLIDVIEEGRVTFTMEPGEHHYNPIGMVHGGVGATLLDSAMGSALHTVLPAGVGYTTLELKVNFLRALSVDTGLVTAEGTVLHAGGRTALTEGKLTDSAGRLLAHATSTCLILRPEGGR